MIHQHRLLLFLGCCFLICLIAPEAPAKRFLNDALITRPFSHHIWQEVLSENIDSSGAVNFDRLRAAPKRLNQYLSQLAHASPLSHPDLFNTRQEQLAYWINAHNALALRLVLDAYPVEDLQAIPNFYQSHRYALGNVPYSLSEVEQIIRQRFSLWPLAPFALSDLTLQSPPLLNEAYRGAPLKQQLQSQTQRVMQDSRFVKVEDGSCTGLAFSPYFQEYRTFLLQSLQTQKGLNRPSLMDFVKPYLSPEIRGQLAAPCQHSLTFLAPDTRLRTLSAF